MARRNGLRDFLEGFNATYSTANKVMRDFDTADVMKDSVTETENYSPEEVAQIEANTAAGKENPYEGVGMSGKTWTYNGKSYDAPISDIQLDGLRAGRLAEVAQKYGDNEGAMRLRSDARQAKREERQDAREIQLDADNKRVREIISGKAPGVDESIEMYNANHGYGGVGQHAGMKIEKIPLQDGTTYLAFKDKDGNVVKGQQYTDEQLADEAGKWHSRHVWTQLANVSPEWYMKARQAGMQDEQLRLMHEKFDWEKDKDTRDSKFRETSHADQLSENAKDRVLRERGLRIQEGQAAKGKQQLVPVYDKDTGEQRMVMVDTAGMKAGDVVKTPDGTTLNKPSDKTDERIKQVASEYKQVTDELEFLQKNKREGEVFSFGKNDPENQDNARIDALRNRAQALNDQMQVIRMAQYLPKGSVTKSDAPGIPRSVPKKVSSEITPEEIAATEATRKDAALLREKQLAAEREKRRQAIAALEAQAEVVNSGLRAR